MAETTYKRWRDMDRRERLYDVARRLRNGFIGGAIIYGLTTWHSSFAMWILAPVGAVSTVLFVLLAYITVVEAFATREGNEHQGIVFGGILLVAVWFIFGFYRWIPGSCPLALALHQSLSTLLNSPDSTVCVDTGWRLAMADVERLVGVVMFGVFLALVLRFFEAQRKRREIKKGDPI